MAQAMDGAPTTQHTLKVTDDTILLRPALARTLPIRAMLLGMGAMTAYGTIVTVPREWPSLTAVVVALMGTFFGLIALYAGLAPWKTRTIRIDITGIHIRGRFAPHVGTHPWHRVSRIVHALVERESVNADHRLRPKERTWHVGLLLDDGTAIGLVRTQASAKAHDMATGLRRIADQAGRSIPIIDALPSDRSTVAAWPPQKPSGYPHHARYRIERHDDGTHIALQERPIATANKYLLWGGGVAAASIAIIIALGWTYHTIIPADFGHGAAVILLALVAVIAASAASQGLILREGIVDHVISEDTFQIIDHKGIVRHTFPLSDVHSFQIKGSTLVLKRLPDSSEDSRMQSESLYFNGSDPTELAWLQTALLYVMAENGWHPIERKPTEKPNEHQETSPHNAPSA